MPKSSKKRQRQQQSGYKLQEELAEWRKKKNLDSATHAKDVWSIPRDREREQERKMCEK